MEDCDFQERRRARRLNRPFAVEVTDGGVLDTWKAVCTHDLSKSGLCFRASTRLPEEATIGVRVLATRKEDTFEVSGRIVWKSPQVSGDRNYGVQFVGLDTRQQRRLGELLQSFSA